MTNCAKNGQNGTRCSVARKWALTQRIDQWCKDKDDVNREEPLPLYFYPQTNKQNATMKIINATPWDLESRPMVPKMVKMAQDVP